MSLWPPCEFTIKVHPQDNSTSDWLLPVFLLIFFQVVLLRHRIVQNSMQSLLEYQVVWKHPIDFSRSKVLLKVNSKITQESQSWDHTLDENKCWTAHKHRSTIQNIPIHLFKCGKAQRLRNMIQHSLCEYCNCKIAIAIVIMKKDHLQDKYDPHSQAHD